MSVNHSRRPQQRKYYLERNIWNAAYFLRWQCHASSRMSSPHELTFIYFIPFEIWHWKITWVVSAKKKQTGIVDFLDFPLSYTVQYTAHTYCNKEEMWLLKRIGPIQVNCPPKHLTVHESPKCVQGRFCVICLNIQWLSRSSQTLSVTQCDSMMISSCCVWTEASQHCGVIKVLQLWST